MKSLDKKKGKELEWEKDLQFEIRKALYIDPKGLKDWKFSVDKWGKNCPMCGKLFVPNDFADEFEKKLLKVVSSLLTQQRTELLEEIKNMPIEVVGNSQATVNQIIRLLN
jgi:hypothetical protein